jgi:hypothetical protein
MFFPQTGTYALPSVDFDGDAYDGVDFGTAVSFRCHCQPMSSTTAYERFGIETSEAMLLTCPVATGITNFAQVIISGITYKGTGLKKFSDGIPTDHIEMMLERVRA